MTPTLRHASRPLLFILLSCLALAAWAAPYAPGPSRRVAQTINREWTFNYLPDANADKAGCQAPDFGDAHWPAVALPHTWSTYETTGELHPFIRNASDKDSDYWWKGWGWYRKHFRLGPEAAGRKVFVEFDGVQKYCKVWLNGQLVGDHKGGFNSFYFDLTPYVNPQGDNVLAIAVRNLQNDPFKIPPMSAGNWDVYGGIYRDVRLVLKDTLHIPYQGSSKHEGGTFVTTPKVDEQNGVARVRTWVRNDAATARRCELATVIADAEGRVIQRLTAERTLQPGELAEFDQTAAPIDHPRLWSPTTPYVYRVFSEVRESGALLDAIESPLGFRWFHWDNAENRLYLNGKKIIINGTNRHQEYPWLGDAVPKWIHLAEMADIRFNLNDNFMRTCHYPQDPVIYDFCDRSGIIINEEVPNIKKQKFDDAVQEQNVREMIRRDRNHPAIFLWSMGNETTDAADSAWAVAEDTTRIIHGRYIYNDSGGKYITHTQEQMGMETLLQCTIRGWYNADVRDAQPQSGQQGATETWQHDQAVKGMLDQNKKRTDGARSNFVTWLYADHGADREYTGTPLLHVNPKGWVDVYRYPKYMYYLWQANFAEQPMVFIHPHFWRRQYAGQKKEIVVDSNCDSVELLANGRSLGTRQPQAAECFVVRFADVPIEAGTLTAVARKGARTVSTSVTLAGEPARLVLSADPARIAAGRDAVAIIKADIVDAAGVHVYGATNTITWTVTGPATLVGPEVYATDINKTEALDGTMYIDAPVNNLVRSTGQAGVIRVSALASGLASGVVELQAVAPAPRPAGPIVEPALDARARQPVARSQAAGKSEAAPQEMAAATEDLELKGTVAQDFARQLEPLLRRRNPKLDLAAAEGQAVLRVFARHLEVNKGSLVRDDYNFTVAHFNDCRRITRPIGEMKLPEPFKKGLIEYYAETMIVQGDEKNYQTERQRLQAIPAKGQVVITAQTDLAKIVSEVNPGFAALGDAKREAFLARVAAFNPYVTRRGGKSKAAADDEQPGKSPGAEPKPAKTSNKKPAKNKEPNQDGKKPADNKPDKNKSDKTKPDKKKNGTSYTIAKGKPVYIPTELTPAE